MKLPSVYLCGLVLGRRIWEFSRIGSLSQAPEIQILAQTGLTEFDAQVQRIAVHFQKAWRYA